MLFRQIKNHRFKLHTTLRVSKPEKSCSHLNNQAFFKEREGEGRKEDEEERNRTVCLSLLTEVITPNLPNLVGYKTQERVREAGEDKELGRGIGGEYNQN